MKNGPLAHPLFLIVGVPLLFVAVVALVAYVPNVFFNAKYDFLYVQPSNRYYYDRTPNFYVESGELKAQLDPRNLPAASGATPPSERDREIESARAMRLYIFDTKSWSAQPVTIEEAQQHRYSSISVSPDGYSIARARAADGVFPFFFGYSSGGDFILKKGVVSRRLPIGESYYNYDSGFIGWVIE